MKFIKEFYKGKRVFVTGQTGFKGAWLCLWLHNMGAEVSSFALEPEDSRGNLYNSIFSGTEINSHFGNLNETKRVAQILKTACPEIVFHLGAQALVRRSYRNPYETYMSNVMGTLSLFQALNEIDCVKSIINITTDKVYENLETEQAYKESDQLGGHDPYSSSKACVEILSSSFQRSFFNSKGIQLVNARAGNVIGGGDFSEDRLIPDFIDAIKKDRVLEIRSPNAIRPWQHVLDVLYGYLLLAYKLAQEGESSYFKAYNFSPIDIEPVCVIDIVKLAIKKIGRGSYNIVHAEGNMHEAKKLMLDSSLVRKDLGWRNLFTIESCVASTIEWYSRYIDKEDPKAICLDQIRMYESKMNEC